MKTKKQTELNPTMNKAYNRYQCYRLYARLRKNMHTLKYVSMSNVSVDSMKDQIAPQNISRFLASN